MKLFTKKHAELHCHAWTWKTSEEFTNNFSSVVRSFEATSVQFKQCALSVHDDHKPDNMFFFAFIMTAVSYATELSYKNRTGHQRTERSPFLNGVDFLSYDFILGWSTGHVGRLH